MGAAETGFPLKGLRTAHVAEDPRGGLPPATALDPCPPDSRPDLDRPDLLVEEPIEAFSACPAVPRPGEEALAEHRLGRPRASLAEQPDSSRDLRRCETDSVGEPFAELEEPLGRRMLSELFPAASCSDDASDRSRAPKDGRRRDGPTDDTHQERAPKGLMVNFPERRDACAGANLEPSSKDGCDAPQSTTAEEVREVGDLHRAGAGTTREGPDGQRGRECPGGAHPEPLADREFVGEAHFEGPGLERCHSTGDVERNRPPTGLGSHDPNPRPRARNEPGVGPGPELEDDSGPYRPTPPRIPVTNVGPEQARHMSRSECAGRPETAGHHCRPPTVLFERTYKRTRFMIGTAAVAGLSEQP